MRVSNTAIGLSLIIFACAVLVHVRSFPKLDNGYPGPALFPSVLAVLFIFCGIGSNHPGNSYARKSAEIRPGDRYPCRLD